MRKFLLLLFLMLFSMMTVTAQPAPDYSIRNIRTPPSDDDIVIQFEIVNNGGAASDETSADVSLVTSNETITSEPVPPLAANAQTTITVFIPLNTTGLEAGQRVLFLIRVGIGDIESENSNTVGDNSAFTPAIIVPGAVSQPDETILSTPAVQPEIPTTTTTGLPFNIDLGNPLHIAMIIGGAGLLLILIWMLTIILRLIFSQPPAFTTWQPPYAYSPLLDPNSSAGRRQLWQQHAQSDTLPPQCAPGTFMARKVLIGMNGGKLQNWRVTAARISQYDMYGRVARSQTIASNRAVKNLDRALRKAAGRSPEKLERMVRPAAKGIYNDFARKLKRTPSLPIALDLRLRGIHGEVRIIFELYQCVDGQWHMVDQWEPEMTVLSGTLTENFTYPLFGQRQGETPRQFRKRLQDDITQMLAAMIQQPIAVKPSTEPNMDTAPVKAVTGDTIANS